MSSRILILAVTASGKGRLAFELAQAIQAEILSVDSMKVYRRMNIGTAKAPVSARAAVPHHLVDVVEPSESFSVAAYLDRAKQVIEQIEGRDKAIVAVGGTALYIKALMYGLFEGPGSSEPVREALRQQAQKEGWQQMHRRLHQLDPRAAARIHPNDAKRIIRALEVCELTGRPISSFQRQFTRRRPHGWTLIGLRRQREVENHRINSRVKKMIADGLVNEVKSLLAEEKPLSRQARCAIGYAEIIEHLEGKTTLEQAVELIKKNTRRLAKAQRTWFKRFRDVHWLDIEAKEPTESILERARALLAVHRPET